MLTTHKNYWKQMFAASGPSIALMAILAQGICLGGTPVAVSLNSATGSLTASQTQSFTAKVTGSANAAVTWSLSSPEGSLATAGNTATFTAPATFTQPGTITIKATSVADPTKTASAIISLVPTLNITP